MSASYAPAAARRYGCQAPAWVQQRPRVIRTWARARALRWSTALGARLALATVAFLAGLALVRLARLVTLASQ